MTVLVLYRCRLCGGFDQSDYWRRGYMDALQRVEHVEAALRDAEARVARARIVADHWRSGALDWGEAPMPGRMAAHPLCLVLDALDGETDPARLGVSAGVDFDALADLAPDETGGAGG